MTKVIGVRFRNVGKIYYFSPQDLEIKAGEHVIVETARGVEYGSVVLPPREVSDEKVVQPLKEVIRIATPQDDKKEEANRKREKEAFQICLKKIREHNLEMKLIDVEYTFDNNKILFYFTADGRIDFRELVKDLAAIFKTRIELRQIGVRDETKILGGIGICGRPLCCHTYLSEFVPVSIKMAKEQNLSLNPTKISGVCGRLMCCLKNEEETYEELNRKLPNPGDRVFQICLKKIREHNLEMKLIDVEYTFDNNKILFYFTADGRIDFRELVKDLAAIFKTRIELRQIGVRDETKILGGIGICGRPLCCHTYLSEFVPVSIKMAKEQNLSLNPTKISGVCGRLMCCLKNEEETYEELNRKLPNPGDRVTTPEGLKGEVQSVNVLRQYVKVIVDVEDEKEIREYQASELKFKARQKREKLKLTEEEMKALKELERDK